ncbi:MAG: response regulator transcription factor, partial [Alteromonadaceae bacterium]|nr:response regulator transcription factor [Alteromonadaceae bacterium]
NTCDVVLSDLHMPDMNGIELLDHLNNLDKPPIFVAMTAYDTDEVMLHVLAKGAAGYVIKGEVPQAIIQALRDAVNGGTSLSPQCVKRLVENASIDVEKSVPDLMPKAQVSLTRSEKAVLRQVAVGKTNREISEQMECSEAYIKKVMTSLLRKFGVESRVQLVLEVVNSSYLK